MSWLHVELTEKANELGFESIEEAEQNGYEISMDGMTPTLKPNTKKQLELAHETWLEEREEVFEMIDNMEKDIVDSVDKKEGHPRYWVDTLERIRAFVEKGEM